MHAATRDYVVNIDYGTKSKEAATVGAEEANGEHHERPYVVVVVVIHYKLIYINSIIGDAYRYSRLATIQLLVY